MPHLETPATVAPAMAPQSQGDINRVDTLSIVYKSMQEHWDLLHDLHGGTLRMQQASTKCLPREPEVDIQSFNI